MGDETKPVSRLTEAEDTVNRWLNGGTCSTTQHTGMTVLEKLIMLKFLRMEFPHQSTTIRELDSAIYKASRQ